jgi:hypothetical protein
MRGLLAAIGSLLCRTATLITTLPPIGSFKVELHIRYSPSTTNVRLLSIEAAAYTVIK